MTRPSSPAELSANLRQFIGTEHYYRIYPNLLATDGAKYLADEAGVYWLLDIVWSVLPKIDDDFAVLELHRKEGTSEATAHLHDGRDPQTTYHRQHIPYTDFPLEHVKLYVQDAGEHWVVMLTGEY